MDTANRDSVFPFRNPALPLEERVTDLLGRLTIDEKLSLLVQLQPAIPRLGIRAFKTGTEALHGVAWLGKATVFPQAIGLGSTWNPDLLRRIGNAVAEEARGFHFRDPEANSLNLWAPVVDLLRDPRAGRNEEGYSEDPLLTGRMSLAYASGLSGDHPFYWKTAPTLKHFFAYNTEDSRETVDSNVDPRNMREYYLRPFEAVLRAGKAAGVMTSYNLVNGRPNTLSPYLESEVRRWSADALMIVGDACGASQIVSRQAYYETHPESHAAALRAGLDSFTEMAETADQTEGYFREAFAQGLIRESDIDRAVAHIFCIRIRLGEFDPADPYAGITDTAILSPAHRQLAREAAREQLVLLKNEKDTLPLDRKSIRRLAVIGRLANEVHVDHYGGTLPYSITPLEAIRDLAGPQVTVEHAAGKADGEAARIARSADAAIVFAGNPPDCDSGWAQCAEPAWGKEAVDRKAIRLPEEGMIREVFNANPRTIVVLVSSFPYAIGWSAENIPAILWSSHAGQELGGALADALFGEYAPAGRLTQTWHASLEDLPPITDYDIIRGRRTYLYFTGRPLFPFGHGLTYTSFRYDNLRIDPDSITSVESAAIRVNVVNTGARPSDEVVQLYVHAKNSRVIRPTRELKGFQRIHLQPGESRNIVFHLPAKELAFWDVTREKWIIESGNYEILVGRSSADIRLAGVLPVEGEVIPPRDPTRLTRAENYDEYAGVRLVDENKVSGNAVGAPAAGGWISFRDSDFGAGVNRFQASTANAGTKPTAFEIRLDSPGGPLAGTAAAPVTDSKYHWADIAASVDGIRGVRDVYLVFKGEMRIRALQFSR